MIALAEKPRSMYGQYAVAFGDGISAYGEYSVPRRIFWRRKYGAAQR
jgi:hypothetical protein